MRIAVIAPTFIPAKRANTLQVMKMTQAIANTGHQVRLAVPEEPGQSRKEDPGWEDMANWYGLTTKFPIDYLPAQSISGLLPGLPKGGVRKKEGPKS